MSEAQHDVVVIGGGVTGLTAAEGLARRGVDVVCLDANREPGGVTSSHRVEGFLFERGPFNVLCRAPEFRELLAELSSEVRIEALDRATGGRRYVLSNGRLELVPKGLLALWSSPLVGFGASLRAARGMLVSRGPAAQPGSSAATVDEVVRRRFGDRIADRLVSALTVGVFGVESDALEARSALPLLGELDAGGVSPLLTALRRRRVSRASSGGAAAPRGMLSFEGGLAALPRALAARLGPRYNAATSAVALTADGERWRVATADGRVFGARRVVLAIDAAATAELLRPLGGPGAALAEGLATVEHSALTVLNLGFRAEVFTRSLDGYGFLVARSDRAEPVLGVLYASSVFPSHAPAGCVSLRVFFGGTRHPEHNAAPEGELLQHALSALRRFAGLRADAEPLVQDLVRWPRAVPIYAPGHAARTARLTGLAAALPGLTLAGTYLDGVSVNDCVARGIRVAAEIGATCVTLANTP